MCIRERSGQVLWGKVRVGARVSMEPGPIFGVQREDTKGAWRGKSALARALSKWAWERVSVLLEWGYSNFSQPRKIHQKHMWDTIPALIPKEYTLKTINAAVIIKVWSAAFASPGYSGPSTNEKQKFWGGAQQSVL